ncbi:hypothetical protein ACXR0O_24680 [Verrucomicrobiota bacterium sgz303538]
MNPHLSRISRRDFCNNSLQALAAAGMSFAAAPLLGQLPGERPKRAESVTVLNPRARVPIGIIIDDSTCLVNLNKFAMPQFDTAFAGANSAYKKAWRDWPNEIPDSFVRKFGEWSAQHGVKGKYSIVPYPACVGRLDRMLPGWTQAELNESLELVRSLMMPNWDIHPEMASHTRVIDLKTGHPYSDHSIKFMENWDWTTGRSADEIGEYTAYALNVLKNAGLSCEGITTPGGFGNKALPQLAQATLQAVRSVFSAEIPHYFRHLYDQGDRSVAPRVEYASGLQGSNPQCVVSIIGCTGDWTGGWDCSVPEGADKFITEDGQRGRLVDVIKRGEPAIMVAHWTGIYWNGQELGFQILQEVERRLHSHFDNLRWTKLSELARYWAARELTQIELNGGKVTFQAPFACPDFTIRLNAHYSGATLRGADRKPESIEQTANPLKLEPGKWSRDGDTTIVCFSLPKGESHLELISASGATSI